MQVILELKLMAFVAVPISSLSSLQTHLAGYTGEGFIGGFDKIDIAASFYLCRTHAGIYRTKFKVANGSESECPNAHNLRQWHSAFDIEFASRAPLEPLAGNDN